MSEASPKTILLVEDEALIAFAEKRLLEKSGYHIIHAISGEKAIDVVCIQKQPVDLILMDINLGSGMDGTETARHILQVCDIPIIFLSGHTEKEVVEKTEEITSYGYIVKNGEATVLLTSIKMAFRLHEAHTLLGKSEARYHQLVEISPDMVAIVHKGIIVFINENGAHLLGAANSNEIIGRKSADFIPNNTMNEAAEQFRKLHTQEHLPAYEQKVTRLDGAVLDVEVQGMRYDYQGEPAIQVIARDITHHKKTEQALRAERDRVQTYLDTIETIIITLDTWGKITMVNRKGCQLLGYTEEELIGKLWFETCLPQPDGMQMIYPMFLQVIIGASPSIERYENPVITKNGEVRFISWSNAFLRDEHGLVQGVISSGEDITERKQAEKALQESETRYRQLVEGAPDIVYTFSSKRGGIYYSQHVKQVLGYSPEDLYANPMLWNESIHPDDNQLLKTVIDCFDTGKPFDVEYRIRDANQNWLWLRDRSFGGNRNDDEIIVEGIVTNITAQKQAEAELLAQKQRLDYILQGTHVGTWEWNVQTGETTFNEQWAAILGYTLAELSPVSIETWVRFSHPEDLETSNQLLQRHFRGELDYYECESRMLHKNGEWVWVLDRGKVATWSPEGTPLMMFGTHQEITEQKRAEEKVRGLLHEKELLLREVHHRVKNNMNAIFSLLELQMDAQDNPLVQRALQDASGRVQSMAILYDKLYRSKDFGEISIKEYLSTLLEEIVHTLPHQKPVKLQINMEDIILPARILSTIGIIINELTTNAMKHAFNEIAEGIISIRIQQKNDEVELIFSDNGSGLPENFQLEHTPGFGMQLVSMLLQQIRGKIHIEKTPGTTFILTFKPA